MNGLPSRVREVWDDGSFDWDAVGAGDEGWEAFCSRTTLANMFVAFWIAVRWKARHGLVEVANLRKDPL